jgi:hypothetical protein
MKGFILILSIVLNSGDNVGGAAIEVPPVVFATMADCQAAADAFIAADGTWPNHRAVCIGKGATVAAARW